MFTLSNSDSDKVSDSDNITVYSYEAIIKIASKIGIGSVSVNTPLVLQFFLGMSYASLFFIAETLCPLGIVMYRHKYNLNNVINPFHCRYRTMHLVTYFNLSFIIKEPFCKAYKTTTETVSNLRKHRDGNMHSSSVYFCLDHVNR